MTGQMFRLLAGSPVGTASDLVKTVFADAIQSSLGAWAQVLDFSRLASYGRGPLVLYLALVLVTVPLAVLYLWKLTTDDGRRVLTASGQSPELTASGQSPELTASG
jgi:hypothetical protein